MPAAARVGDTTAHGGTVTGPGVTTVLVGGMPAAVLGDMHACVIPSPPPHPPATPFVAGSGSVLIQGKPALRAGDSCGCGASVAVGVPTVVVGSRLPAGRPRLGVPAALDGCARDGRDERR